MKNILMNKWTVRASVVATTIASTQLYQVAKAAASGWAKR